jgi:hypothetical protein
MERAMAAAENLPASMGALNAVANLAQILVRAEKRTAEADEALKKAKENERRIREESLPCAMEECGLTDMTLATGEKITVGLEVYCAIPAAMKEKVWKWLEEHDYDGIIKTNVAISFGKGEVEAAKALEALISDGRMANMVAEYADEIADRIAQMPEATTPAAAAESESLVELLAGLNKLIENGMREMTLDRNVHPQTLKSFVKEQLQKEVVEIPLELFGARPVQTAKVKQPKK